MKVAVLGAGAMGSLYGAKLSRTQDVTMVDVNDALIEQINQNGIVVQEADGTETVCQLKAVKSGTDIGVQDLVIVFVKGIFTKDTVQQNLSLIGENTLVLTLQNGAGNNRHDQPQLRGKRSGCDLSFRSGPYQYRAGCADSG